MDKNVVRKLKAILEPNSCCTASEDLLSYAYDAGHHQAV